MMSTVAALVLVTMAIKGAVDQSVFGRSVDIRTSQSSRFAPSSASTR